MMYSGQSANLREDFTYTARDQQSFLTRYSNLAATVTVGTTSMGYDAVGRVTNLQHKDASAVNIANYTHTYDAASRVTTEKLNGGATTTYQYDTVDELTNDAVVSYTYDFNGNRTMSGYATGLNNQLTSDGTWNYYADKNGNITQKINPSTGEVLNFGYDNRNRLTTVTDTTSSGLQMQGTYTHDALGQRIEKAVWTASGGSTVTTRFAYDQRQIIADLDGSSNLTTRYLLGMRVLERFARISSAGTVAWLLTDRLGSVRNVVNSGGSTIDTAAFDGFGNIVEPKQPEQWRSVSLRRLSNRWYSSSKTDPPRPRVSRPKRVHPQRPSVDWFTSSSSWMAGPQEVEDGQGGRVRTHSPGPSPRQDEHSATGPQVSSLAAEDPRDPGPARAQALSTPGRAVGGRSVQAGHRRDPARR